MNLRTGTIAIACGILMLSGAAAQAAADSPPAKPGGAVSDLMLATQLRHIKLWFAGRLLNWQLAAYELDQVKSRLREAAALSPASPPDRTAEPVESLRKAIDTKDTPGFVKAYTELTNACTACHRASGRGYISIQVPVTSPFSDELFVDQLAEGRALAHSICGACHQMPDTSDPATLTGFQAPSFSSLAQRPLLTADSLRQLLSSSHRNLGQDQKMPNPRLADYQIEEIIAYLATLRSKDQ